MNFDFEKIKEIADLYGIIIEEVEDGQEGFVVDTTGEVRKSLPLGLIERLVKCSKSVKLENPEYFTENKKQTLIKNDENNGNINDFFPLAA